MQENISPRSNKQRTEATRALLIGAARALFIEKGYSDTGTPEIVANARVTRGALYHHFVDKADLFRAVIVQEADAVAAQIDKNTAAPGSALEAFMAGADAYFNAMAVPGRARLLLLEGPAVLGHGDMNQIDKQAGGAQLRQGLMAAIEEGALNSAPLDALTELLSAAFDRAALAIAEGRPPEEYRRSILLLMTGLLGK